MEITGDLEYLCYIAKTHFIRIHNFRFAFVIDTQSVCDEHSSAVHCYSAIWALSQQNFSILAVYKPLGRNKLIWPKRQELTEFWPDIEKQQKAKKYPILRIVLRA